MMQKYIRLTHTLHTGSALPVFAAAKALASVFFLQVCQTVADRAMKMVVSCQRAITRNWTDYLNLDSFTPARWNDLIVFALATAYYHVIKVHGYCTIVERFIQPLKQLAFSPGDRNGDWLFSVQNLGK
jgi:hypothetical protein